MRTWAKFVALATVISAPFISAHPASAAYACMGRPATLVGTQAADVIKGIASSGPDVIVTLGGDDTVLAGDGNDIVCSGSGDDTVSGMRGKDAIRAGDGDDAVGGGYNSDVLYLGRGADAYYGDARGSVNHLDIVYGQDGRDQIDTDLDSPMIVHGGSGGDWIRAYSRWSDHVYGGRGADTIDVRDFDYYQGTYVQSDDADTVEAGPQPQNTQDSCVVNINDTVVQCEAVKAHSDASP